MAGGEREMGESKKEGREGEKGRGGNRGREMGRDTVKPYHTSLNSSLP